jgi:hypothetical protein
MPLDPVDARQQGEAARDAGMILAAQRKEWFIHRDTLRFLDAMMSRSDRTASTDDAVDDLADTYADGGKWRGSIVKELAGEGLIVKAGIGYSDRPARHRGYVARWRGTDLRGIDRRRDDLRRWLATHPCPPEPDEKAGDDCDGLLFSMIPTNKPSATVAAAAPGKTER